MNVSFHYLTRVFFLKLQQKTNRVTPIIDEDEVVEFKGLTEEEERLLGLDDTVLQTVPENKSKEAVPPSVLPDVPKIKGGSAVYRTKTIRQQQIKCAG